MRARPSTTCEQGDADDCGGQERQCQQDGQRNGETAREPVPPHDLGHSRRRGPGRRGPSLGAAQPLEESGPVRWSRRGILREGALGEECERRRSIRANRAHRGRCLLDVLPGDLQGLARLERQPAAQHPEEQHPERVDVARGCHGTAHGLFRRHVGGRSEQGSLVGQRVDAAYASDPEVGDLRAPLLVEEDVRRLQVAVYEPALVGVREP